MNLFVRFEQTSFLFIKNSDYFLDKNAKISHLLSELSKKCVAFMDTQRINSPYARL